MIFSVRGKLIYTDKNYVVVECGGVGYKCFAALSTVSRMPKCNEEVFLYTYLAIKEDAADLYGFYTVEELECFKMLISVSGVGPKAALALLSEFTPDRILLMIASSDSKSLTAASGIGNKMAQRIVLELKDKVGGLNLDFSGNANVSAVASGGEHSNIKEAVTALTALGFSQSDAASAVSKYNTELSTQDLIKAALKELSRQV